MGNARSSRVLSGKRCFSRGAVEVKIVSADIAPAAHGGGGGKV